MQANSEAMIVPATVVAPSIFFAMMGAISRLDALITPLALARYSNWVFERPTVSWPLRIAMVAGIAP